MGTKDPLLTLLKQPLIPQIICVLFKTEILPEKVNKMSPINELKNAFIQKLVSKFIFQLYRSSLFHLIEHIRQEADSTCSLKGSELALLISL